MRTRKYYGVVQRSASKAKLTVGFQRTDIKIVQWKVDWYNTLMI